ncbi:MAG: MFS transporter [Lautropia sp.]
MIGDAPRRPGVALAATLAVQLLGSFCLMVPAVLAPAVAPELGFRPERVGLFVGIAYLAAMLSGLSSGRGVASIGAVGLSQATMLGLGVGMLAIGIGHVAVLIVVALLFGVAYGFINPATAELLNRHAPPAHRGLIFSLKQSGVPLGVALAGVLMPLGLERIGWRWSLLLVGAACIGHALLLFAARRPLEPERAAARERGGAAAGAGTRWAPPVAAGLPALARVLKDPPLRRVGIASFAFAFSQLCFVTFLVSYLNLERGQSLALAAGVLALSQVVSTVFRVVWGAVGDRWIGPGLLLGWLGIGAGFALLGLGALAGAGGGLRWTIALVVLCAITAMSWNGVFFAELARRTPRQELAAVAGAVQFMTFAGSMSGPVAFSELLRSGFGYGFAYVLIAALPFAAGLMMVLRDEPMPAGPVAEAGRRRVD